MGKRLVESCDLLVELVIGELYNSRYQNCFT